MGQLALLPPSKTQKISSLHLQEHMDNVPVSNSPGTLELPLSLDVSLQEHSLIRSKPLSVNQDCWSSLIHLMPTSQSLLSAMLIHQLASLTWLSHATTHLPTPLDLCGGFWPEKFCDSVDLSPVNCNGM